MQRLFIVAANIDAALRRMPTCHAMLPFAVFRHAATHDIFHTPLFYVSIFDAAADAMLFGAATTA